jgi:S-adenosylmethionine hydrolase
MIDTALVGLGDRGTLVPGRRADINLIDLAALGRSAGAVQHLDIPRATFADGRIDGQILRVDRFGNLISNIDRRTFEKFAGGPLDIRIGTHQVSRVVSTYADASPGEVCALFGSTDHLEIAANGASAAEALHAGRGALVHVARRA